MEFSITQDELLKPLQIISGVVDKKVKMVILSNFLLEVSAEHLKITATDTGVEWISSIRLSDVVTLGEITVPARKFIDLCRMLPEQGLIKIKLEKNQLIIRCGRSRSILNTILADDFPKYPTTQVLQTLNLSTNAFIKLLKKTYFCMAQQDVRFYFNGVFLEFKENQLVSVATNGHRLGYAQIKVNNVGSQSFSVIIPRKAILEMLRAFDNDSNDELQLLIGEAFICLQNQNLTLTTKLIEGQFPNYRSIIHANGQLQMTTDAQELKKVLQRVAVLANEKYPGVRFSLTKNKLKVLVINFEQEEAEEELEVDNPEATLQISFNVFYLIDILNNLPAGHVRFEFKNIEAPVLIQSIQDVESIYMIMPMQL